MIVTCNKCKCKTKPLQSGLAVVTLARGAAAAAATAEGCLVFAARAVAAKRTVGDEGHGLGGAHFR